MNNFSIQKEHEDKIHFAVKSGLGGEAWECLGLLSGGLTGAPVYHLKVNGKFYVIKLENIDDEDFDLKRNYEIITRVSAQEICPRVYLADARQGILLMEYVKPERAENVPENIRKFAGMCSR